MNLNPVASVPHYRHVQAENKQGKIHIATTEIVAIQTTKFVRFHYRWEGLGRLEGLRERGTSCMELQEFESLEGVVKLLKFCASSWDRDMITVQFTGLELQELFWRLEKVRSEPYPSEQILSAIDKIEEKGWSSDIEF